jgi:putative peptidoglycan lipid II flippase
VSRLLGLGRELVIAALYGATGATSAFRTATRVSTAAYDLLLSGAITSALVPVLSDYAAGGQTAELSRIASTFVNLTLLGLGLIVGLLVLGAPQLVAVLGADSANFALAVDLTRIALPSILLLGISGILTATLYARQSFRVPAFAPAIYNAGVIVAAVVLAGPLGIYGLALGLSVGAALQILVQLPALRGLHYVPIIDWRHPGVRQVGRLYAPVFLGMLASYLVVGIDTHLAWSTGAESVADMAFATTLIQFPIGLVGAAASLAILPALSRLASSGDQAGYERTLVRGLRMVLLLIVPLGIALVVLRVPTVALLFQRLAFDAAATERTALALLAYSPQLPFVVVDQLLIVAFYARKNTMTPVLVGVLGVGIYLVVALVTVGPLGMPGLALANAVQNSAHAVILFVLLARRHPTLRGPSFGSFIARIAFGALVAALATSLAASVLQPLLDQSFLPTRLFALAVAAGIGILVYAVTVRLLRVEELTTLRSLLRRSR